MRWANQIAMLLLSLAIAACGGGGGSAGDPGGGGNPPGGGGPGGGGPGGGGPGGGGSATFVGLRQVTNVWSGPIQPFGVADDGAGGAWVTDPQFRLLRHLDSEGRTIAAIDGTTVGATPFVNPMGVAVDPVTHAVFVSDAVTNVVQGFMPDGTWVRSVTGAPGNALSAPYGLAFDAAGVLYVADSGNHRVRAFAPGGAEGTAIGAGATTLTSPYGVYADGSGVYVADTGANAVRKFSAAGALLATIDGSAAGAKRFAAPAGVAVAANGDVWVVDTGNAIVQKFNAAGAYVSQIDAAMSANGAMVMPMAIAMRADGSILVADTGNGLVRRYDAAGVPSGVGDAGPVLLSKPRGVAIDRSGTPWIADSGNGLLVALGSSGAVRTLSGASASSTPFTSPWAPAFATDGSLWVADTGANVVRKLDASGATLLTLRGTEGGGDAFVEPMSVAVDGTGSVWVADSGNSVVRKFDAQGASLLTVARPGSIPRAVAIDPASGGMYVARTGANVVEAFNADGSSRAVWDGTVTGATPFSAPAGVTVDATGRVFVADTGNDIVQVFQRDGAWITTIRGSESGAARLDAPYGVAVDPNGNLWVAEAGSNRVQVFGAATSSGAANAFSSPLPARPAARVATTTPGATALNEFQYSGSASYLATQYDPNTPSKMVLYYKGSARWTFTYVFDPQSGLYISDATRSRIEGTRSKYYTDRNGGATLCDQPARLTDVSLLGTQRLTLTGLQDEIAHAVLPLPTELLLGCDTAGPGVLFSSFYPPIGGTIPDFPPRMLPRGWEAKFPTDKLTTGSSQVLWHDKFKNTGRHERTISDGTKRIDINSWTINVVLSGVVPGAYVGLGDSFSAATGASPTGPEPCLRSPNSYVEMHDSRTPKNTIFAACSGATTDSITSAFNGPPQAEQIPYTADEVSITIGGNDARLFSVLTTCVMKGALPLPCSVMRPTAMADAASVAPKIVRALAAIKASAPSAKVAILEYPNPFPDKNTTGCLGLRHPDVPLLGVRAFDVQFFHDLVVEVNKQVSAAASTAGASFVPTATVFAGHDMCSTAPWFGPANGKPESFHPNDRGNEEMAKALQAP